MINRNNLWSAIGLLVVAAGCSRAPQQAGPPPVAEVAVVTVAPQRLVLTTELPGRTAPHLIADIRPQINGLIQKRLFTEGADVQANLPRLAMYGKQTDKPVWCAQLTLRSHAFNDGFTQWISNADQFIVATIK